MSLLAYIIVIRCDVAGKHNGEAVVCTVQFLSYAMRVQVLSTNAIIVIKSGVKSWNELNWVELKDTRLKRWIQMNLINKMGGVNWIGLNWIELN